MKPCRHGQKTSAAGHDTAERGERCLCHYSQQGGGVKMLCISMLYSLLLVRRVASACHSLRKDTNLFLHFAFCIKKIFRGEALYNIIIIIMNDRLIN